MTFYYSKKLNFSVILRIQTELFLINLDFSQTTYRCWLKMIAFCLLSGILFCSIVPVEYLLDYQAYDLHEIVDFSDSESEKENNNEKDTDEKLKIKRFAFEHLNSMILVKKATYHYFHLTFHPEILTPPPESILEA